MSDEYRYSFGRLAEGHDLPENLRLKTAALPAIPSAKRAVDSATARRQGVLLLGPKGNGKSVGARLAAKWFDQVQREKAERDSNYRRQYMIAVLGDRDASYWDTAVNLARKVDPGYNERVRGRKRDQNEIRRDIVELMLATDRTLLLVDEAEKCSAEALTFFRDLMSEAEEIDLKREGNGGGQRAAGIGVVLVGIPEMVGRPAIQGEIHHRWSERIQIPGLSLERYVALYEEWLPGFSQHIGEIGSAAWTDYVGSLLGTSHDALSVRLVATHVRLYVLRYVRHHKNVTSAEEIRFDRNLFERAFWSAGGQE